MTQATKKKHVTREVVDNYEFPDENQEIVQVCSRYYLQSQSSV